jgi:hypothetical protein
MGMLDRLRPRADITVTTDKAVCLPGDEVSGTIRIATKKKLELEEGRAELVMENEYEAVVEQPTSSGGSSIRTTKFTDRCFVGKERLIDPGPLARGWSSEHVVTFRVPDDAVPSGKGKITDVRWQVRGVLARQQARDAIGRATVTVLSRPERYAVRGSGRPKIDAEGCELEVRLPDGAHLRAGETVSGTLVVLPHERVELQEVRVELQREENVPTGHGNLEFAVEATVVLAEDTELDSRTEFPFRLAAPAGICPCFETEQSTVRWWLRGVLARRMRSDFSIKQELNVYTGPGTLAPEAMAAAVAAAEAARAELDVFQRPPGSAV